MRSRPVPRRQNLCSGGGEGLSLHGLQNTIYVYYVHPCTCDGLCGLFFSLLVQCEGNPFMVDPGYSWTHGTFGLA